MEHQGICADPEGGGGGVGCGPPTLNRKVASKCFYRNSDSFTILGLWVLGLAVSHINESNCKLLSPDYFNDKSAILLHPGTRWNKTLHIRDKFMRVLTIH